MNQDMENENNKNMVIDKDQIEKSLLKEKQLIDQLSKKLNYYVFLNH